MKPILLVTDAGHGETPACPSAKLRPRDICTYRGDRVVVAIVVPPGFPAEYALADAFKRARPLMISRTSRAVRYIIGYLDRDPATSATLIPEKDLRPTGERFDGEMFEASR